MKLTDNNLNKKLTQQNNRCYYCGVDLIKGYSDVGNIEIDHKKPFSKHRDGTNINLVLACRDCNRKKREYEIDEFKEKCLVCYPNKLNNNLFYFELINI